MFNVHSFSFPLPISPSPLTPPHPVSPSPSLQFSLSPNPFYFRTPHSQFHLPVLPLSQSPHHLVYHDTKIVGQLVNIGQKGLAFRYTPQPSDTTEFKVIDILGIGLERWRLPEVASKRAYDISVLAENKVPVVNYDEDEITRELETARMLSERRVITANNNPDGTISH
jgi:hypothetical protein